MTALAASRVHEHAEAAVLVADPQGQHVPTEDREWDADGQGDRERDAGGDQKQTADGVGAGRGPQLGGERQQHPGELLCEHARALGEALGEVVRARWR
jgi:hypothetical protein